MTNFKNIAKAAIQKSMHYCNLNTTSKLANLTAITTRVKIANAVESFKGLVHELSNYYKGLSPKGKVIFVLVVFVCKFILPDVIAFPALFKWMRKHPVKSSTMEAE